MEFVSGEVGILILHEPPHSQEIAFAWAKALRNEGLTVVMPRLTELTQPRKKLIFERWKEWLEISNSALMDLKERCSTVFVAGLDGGSSIALRLAQLHGDGIDGLILVEPTHPANQLRSRRIWKMVNEALPLILQPIIIIYSTQSHPDYSDIALTISSNISSPYIRETVIEDPSKNFPTILAESKLFINEITHGFWLPDIATEVDAELIDAEFASIVAGLSLDESTPTSFLDEQSFQIPVGDEEHFEIPNPVLEPIRDPAKRNAIFAMLVGPIYTVIAALTRFDPFGIEPWPGILVFLGGLVYFFYTLRDNFNDDDGAIL